MADNGAVVRAVEERLGLGKKKEEKVGKEKKEKERREKRVAIISRALSGQRRRRTGAVEEETIRSPLRDFRAINHGQPAIVPIEFPIIRELFAKRSARLRTAL
ncbi:hypothetical protein K0M31_013940 [Melipona bicolor]|uniref:Uncharacterized protein n=1 Tax=Melipona bicolor TaxID=60889 RepID=A0AA40KTU0_9HYME|nr:hypothetical protein K0M31_013940 [Melipona bicolor]